MQNLQFCLIRQKKKREEQEEENLQKKKNKERKKEKLTIWVYIRKLKRQIQIEKILSNSQNKWLLLLFLSRKKKLKIFFCNFCRLGLLM